MCGICGIIDPAQPNTDSIKSMLSAIAHRGPDDEGHYINDLVAIGNRRLSIIDLSGGKQPISNQDDTLWIVFNGEIYNYRGLRQALVEDGYPFKTDSDTEVILALYEKHGADCVSYLRGMFAFAIWDARDRSVFIARDHLGQKPLFYAWEDGRFLFGSEIKSILSISQTQPEIDLESLHHYLSLRFIPPPNTMLKHVKKLPPAHRMVIKDGQADISRYWQLDFRNKRKMSIDAFQDELQNKLTETVDAHMISDVPVGAFLSGGMDSSMVVGVMAQDLKQEVSTFAVGVEEQDFNELPFAKEVADHHHTNHIETCVESNLIESLPHMIWHLDEPSDPIAACQYHAAKLASQHVKVVLGGDGGDELFAGFDRYLGVGYIGYYAMIPAFLRSYLIGPVLNQMPNNFSYKNLTEKLRWMHQLAAYPNTATRYAEATVFFRYTHADKSELFTDNSWSSLNDINSADAIVSQYNRALAADPIERMLFADYHTRLPEHSLMLTDRMTMAHGLELRSPFLDHELVEMLATYPVDTKIKDGELKYILRRLGNSYLPESIVKRDKQGFMFPVAYWFREQLYPFLRRFLLNAYIVEAGIFRANKIEQLIEEHRQSRVDHHVRLWMLLNLEIWYRMYIEQQSVETVTQAIRAAMQQTEAYPV